MPYQEIEGLQTLDAQTLAVSWNEARECLLKVWRNQSDRWAGNLRTSEKWEDTLRAQGAMRALEDLWNKLEAIVDEANEEISRGKA